MDANFWLLLVLIALLMALMVFPTAPRSSAAMARRLIRLERKVDLVLRHLEIQCDMILPDLPERVKDLAKDPAKKIQAIKAYREETGAGLAEAKEAVEAWMEVYLAPRI